MHDVVLAFHAAFWRACSRLSVALFCFSCRCHTGPRIPRFGSVAPTAPRWRHSPPEVLSQTLSERAQGVPGVRRRTVFITGSPSKPWNQADTSVAPDRGVEWTVAELRKQLNEDVATSLGTPPKQLDVLVRLAHAVSSKSTSKAVTGKPSPKITGTGA